MPKMERVEILGVQIDNVTSEEALERIQEMICSRRPHQIVTPAIEQIVRARHDAEFNQVFAEADLVVPDGMQVVFASKLHKTPLKERVTGVDLVPRICEMAAREGYSVFFMGGEEGVAEETAAILKRRYPELRIVGTYYPPYRFESNPEEERKALERIRQSAPDVLFVAMSSPRQEKWIRRRKEVLGVPVMAGVGGAFNLITGREKRAPQWMQNLGIEGLYRMVQRPKDLWRRVFVSVPYFLLLIFDQLSYSTQKQVARWGRPLVLALGDLLLAPLTFLFSYWLYFRSGLFPGAPDPFPDTPLTDMPAYSDLLRIVAFLSLPALGVSRLYVRDKYLPYQTLVWRTAKAALLLVFILIGFQFVLKDIFLQYRFLGFSRVVFALFGLSYFLALLSWRSLFRAMVFALHRQGIHLERIILVGQNPLIRDIFQELLEHPELGNFPLGYVTSGANDSPLPMPPEAVRLGNLQDLERILPARKVDEVLITEPEIPLHELERIVVLCARHRVTVSVLPSIHPLLGVSSTIKRLGKTHVIALHSGHRIPTDFTT